MAKKKTTKKGLDIGGIADQRAKPQQTAEDVKKVKTAKGKAGRPRKTAEEKAKVKIVNLRIDKDFLESLDDHLADTKRSNRHQYIIDSIAQRMQREKSETAKG